MLGLDQGSAATLPAHASTALVARRGDDDCVVAALATALRLDYEHAASVLGFGLLPDNGRAHLPPGRGLSLNQVAGPLFAMGIAAVHLIAQESPAVSGDPLAASVFYPSTRIRDLLQGHQAIIETAHLVATPQGDRMQMHALGWDGHTLVDDSGRSPTGDKSYPLWGALVFVPYS